MTEIIRHNGTAMFFVFVIALVGNAVMQCYWWSLMLRAILRKFFGIGVSAECVDAADGDHENQQVQDLRSPQLSCRQRHPPAQQNVRTGTGGGTGGFDHDGDSQELSI